VRNEAYALLAILLMFTATTRAAPGSWFSPSPCTEAPPAPQPGERQVLLVHYQPNSPPHEVVLEVGADQLWRVPLEEWQRWTPLPAQLTTAADGAPRALLKAGAALALRFDACTSELWVDANPQRHYEKNLNRPPPHPVARAGYGGFLNLDFSYGGLAGYNDQSSLIDVGAFGPAGAGRSDFFIGNDIVRRLDSYWIHDDTGSATRLRLGDSITQAADWETPVHFGGLQWGTDFSLQPGRIFFPLPSVSGSAALPSTAQLYVNGVQQSQQALQPGQFRFDSVPTVTGAGDLSIVIRDSLGRLQTVTQPFYTSPRLLAAGLDADTLEIGFLRINYSGTDDHYSQPFAATTWQHGFTDTFSGLFRSSASARRQLVGTEGDYIVSTIGVVTLSGAASHTEAGSGGIGTVAFDRQANDLSVSLSRRAATRDYGDLGRDPGTLHFADSARISWNAHRAGIASIVYDSQQPWASSAQAAGVKLAGLAWNIQAGRSVAGFASLLHTLSGGGGNSIVVGFSMTLGSHTSGSVQWTHDPENAANVSIQHSPPGQLGWSYTASASSAEDGMRQAQAVLTTERGSFGGGWAGVGGSGSPSVVAQTAIAFLDGHAYWTRPVQNSFAVVEAGDAPGVSVYRENQLVGTTDAQGRLLVPDLQPFSVNRLSIDDSALPVATGLTASDVQIAPPANAGVPVRFKVDTQPATRLELFQTSGDPVPAGASLWLDGQELPLPVGYDGLVYAKILDGKHVLEARWAEGACRLRIEMIKTQPRMEFCHALER
jgi:outer membrane usher protein